MAQAGTASATTPVAGVVAVMLVDHQPRHRAWAWLQLARGASAFAGSPGLRFAKVMGSGEGGGFGLRPSATHQGVVALFDTPAQAQAFLAGPRAQAYRERALHWWTGLLAVTGARGAWDGCAWAPTPDDVAQQDLVQRAQDPSPPFPIATLTRASIRTAKLTHFRRRAPAAQRALLQADGCGLAIGLGEAPLLRQCTFSLWRDAAAMEAYARGGAHGRAAAAAYRHDFFSETLFVRMSVLATDGRWTSAPLSHPQGAAVPADEQATAASETAHG